MLIADYQDRMENNKKNRLTILEFLTKNRYSNLKNIAFKLGHKSTSTASRVLKKLVAEKLVKRADIREDFFNAVLFGITEAGINEAGYFVDDYKPFHKSRVSLRNLNHTLLNQRVGIWLFKLKSNDGAAVINMEFGNLKKYDNIIKFKHRPDLLLMLKGNLNIAIETELSLKDIKRYRVIWSEYIRLKKARKLARVWYFVKSDRAKEKLESLMQNFMWHDTSPNETLIRKDIFNVVVIGRTIKENTNANCGKTGQ